MLGLPNFPATAHRIRKIQKHELVACTITTKLATIGWKSQQVLIG